MRPPHVSDPPATGFSAAPYGMSDDPKRRPGDRILDRYCPQLSAEEREQAHERLRRLARAIVSVSKRLEAEDMHSSDSTHSNGGGRIPLTPPNHP